MLNPPFKRYKKTLVKFFTSTIIKSAIISKTAPKPKLKTSSNYNNFYNNDYKFKN